MRREQTHVHGSIQFDRRSALYALLDRELFSRTRFFAAAALTNAVLAQFFRFAPRSRARPIYHVLNNIGSMLEAANVQFARNVRCQLATGERLDHYLVTCEQRLVQGYLDAHDSPNEVRGELNGLLNESHVASLFSRWLMGCHHYHCILRKIRREMRAPLDFANEVHRVRIGLALIHQIRCQEHGSGNLNGLIQTREALVHEAS
jgi:hypothetical protein